MSELFTRKNDGGVRINSTNVVLISATAVKAVADDELAAHVARIVEIVGFGKPDNFNSIRISEPKTCGLALCCASTTCAEALYRSLLESLAARNSKGFRYGLMLITSRGVRRMAPVYGGECASSKWAISSDGEGVCLWPQDHKQ